MMSKPLSGRAPNSAEKRTRSLTVKMKPSVVEKLGELAIADRKSASYYLEGLIESAWERRESCGADRAAGARNPAESGGKKIAQRP